MTRRTRLAVLLVALAVLVLIVSAAIAADLFAGSALATSRPAPLPSPHLPGDADVPPPDSSSAGQARGPEDAKRSPRSLGTAPDPVPVTSPSVDSESAHGLRPASVAASTPAVGVPPAAGTIFGLATWFRSPAGVSAAGPALRAALGPGWRGQTVRVCTASTCIVTVLGDWMQADRLIDLDTRSFAALAPLSVGVLRVTVTPVPAPPETSTP